MLVFSYLDQLDKISLSLLYGNSKLSETDFTILGECGLSFYQQILKITNIDKYIYLNILNLYWTTVDCRFEKYLFYEFL